MSIVPSLFGLAGGDPLVPDPTVRLCPGEAGQSVVVVWDSTLPAAANPEGVLPWEWRLEGAVECAVELERIESPWSVRLCAEGPDGALHLAVILDCGAVDIGTARTVSEEVDGVARGYTMTVWAAWHLSREVVSGAALYGAMWLLGAEMPWWEAVETANFLTEAA